MSTPSERLAALGLTLPPVATPQAAYVPAVRAGDYVYVSGQLPIVDGKLQAVGKVGDGISAEEGAALARLCALNGLAAAASVVAGGPTPSPGSSRSPASWPACRRSPGSRR